MWVVAISKKKVIKRENALVGRTSTCCRTTFSRQCLFFSLMDNSKGKTMLWRAAYPGSRSNTRRMRCSGMKNSNSPAAGTPPSPPPLSRWRGPTTYSLVLAVRPEITRPRVEIAMIPTPNTPSTPHAKELGNPFLFFPASLFITTLKMQNAELAEVISPSHDFVTFWCMFS